MRTVLMAAAATMLLAQPTMAQNPTPGANPPVAPKARPGTTQDQSQQSIRSKIQQNLQAAGFTDIKIMPSSFLVRAKDRDGNPMMMVINPDSVTAITETGAQVAPGATTGSSSPNPNPGPAKR
jgi:hypothetical protein